jgi:molybdenum cofactor cytidylyltransferase
VDGDRSVGAIVLAAGTSRRYGSPKQLVVVDGRTLLEHAIASAFAAELEPVVAVVPVWLPRPASLGDPRLHWIRNAFPERGLSLSLRLGIEAIAGEVSASVILLGDQPRIAVATIKAVVDARGDRPLVAAEAEGMLAPPVLVERTHFYLFDGLVGDIGLREMLRQRSDLVTSVPVAGHAPDVDTPADLDLAGGGRR